MSRNVRFKLSAEELSAVSHFSFAVNMPIDVVAKQSLFWAIQEATRRAELERKANGNTPGNPPPQSDLPSNRAALGNENEMVGPAGGTEAGAE